ncbi:ATP-binding protein [Streptomyces sp. NPDC091272]|uniref:ATP-binding protein n=1 Tax=Streptomyces sp. NPDC091272 TaxID=3365981 RepID=UPI00381A8E31
MALGYTRRTGTLPLEVTGFVGRTAELGQVRELLRRSRLVTLVGPGGVGKSRLALRGALAAKGEYDDGSVLVELSALRDPELLPGAVADALGLPEQTGRDMLDVVMEHLAPRRLLLVLDTCEHLLDACALLADLLLREVPGVTVLATSRQPLDVPGEHTLAVPPLEIGDALALFAQRADAILPGFTVDESNRADVTALCGRLDGIPLAIELATVRLRALPLAQLTARLEDRFQILTGGRRSASLPRHQTLRTAIDWSHDLCSEPERALWARLSVFAGPFDLTAVEEICAEGPGDTGAADGVLPRAEVLEFLVGLVDKSVVLRVGENGAHYRLLDTIREYGADRCADDERARLARRHQDHYFARARRFADRVVTSEQVPLYRQLHHDLANLRSAFEYALGRPEGVRPALRAATGLWPFWATAGLFKEGRYWISKGLALEGEPCEERAAGFLWGSLLATMQGDIEPALTGFETARAVAAEAGDDLLLALALGYAGGVGWLFGDEVNGRRMLDDSLVMQHRLNDHFALIVHHYQRAYMHSLLRHADEATEHADEALRRIGSGPGAGPDGAAGECMIRSQALGIKGMAAWVRGDAKEAFRLALTSVALSRELQDVFGTANSLELLAWGAAGTDRTRQSAWLLGACGELWRKVGNPMVGVAAHPDDRARVEREVREKLGDETYGRLFAQGARLPLDRVVELALAGSPVPAPAPPPGPGADRAAGRDHLTRREREVADLVSAGLTNREISERLVISKRTADAHVEHILAKLGFSSRTQITALAQEPPAGDDRS